MALPDGEAILQVLRRNRLRMDQAMSRLLTGQRNALEQLAGARVLCQPQLLLESMKIRVSDAERNLDRAASDVLARANEQFGRTVAKLEALNPLSVLRRGYAVVCRNEQTVSTVEDVAVGDELQIRLANGTINANAISKNRLESYYDKETNDL